MVIFLPKGSHREAELGDEGRKFPMPSFELLDPVEPEGASISGLPSDWRKYIRVLCPETKRSGSILKFVAEVGCCK